MASLVDRRTHLAALAARLVPGGVLEAVEPVRPDTAPAAGAAGATAKAEGYSEPLRLIVREPGGGRRDLVFRTMAANPFGHERRADRFDGLVLAYDGFGALPDHVPALEVGAVAADGALRSLAGCGEPYLVTGWAEGRPYADDLRRIAGAGAGPLDLARCDHLVDWLVRLHRAPVEDPAAWRRAQRDLLGHGEGIFGIVDGYPGDAPGAPPERLAALERLALEWRWRLRGRAARLRRTHGDFHPFNILFGEGTRLVLLDASRGGLGDPADDLTALTVNYPFFALDRPGAWARLGPLWRRAWARYLAASGDRGLLEAAAPYLAWRALVLGCPRFYPHLSAGARSALLGLAERALGAEAFDPAWAEGLFPVTAPGGAVAWFTGLPASGKSTLAARVRDRLALAGVQAVLLDGDEVRRALVPAPGYGPADRDAFYATLARLAALLAHQGQVVLVAATAPRRAHRGQGRALAPRFLEVYLDTPVAECQARDPKGLWASAAAGDIRELPGAGAPYEPPTAPEVVATGGHDDEAARAVVARLAQGPAGR